MASNENTTNLELEIKVLWVYWVVLTGDYTENSFIFRQNQFLLLVTAVEKARLQHALLVFVEELNRVQVLVVFNPPNNDLPHDCTLRLYSYFLQRDVAVELRTIAVKGDKVEAAAVLTVALDSYYWIIIPKNGRPLIVLFFLPSWWIVLTQPELDKLGCHDRQNLHLTGASLLQNLKQLWNVLFENTSTLLAQTNLRVYLFIDVRNVLRINQSVRRLDLALLVLDDFDSFSVVDQGFYVAL